MPDTYVVTGAGGFIGQHLVAHILDSQDDLKLVAQGSPEALEGIHDERLIPVAARLDGLSDALEDAGIDEPLTAVFHLAASVAKHAGPEDVDGIISSNIEGTRALLTTFEGRARRVVFASTLDVYGVPSGILSESSPLAPSTVYAASKLMGEVLVKEWAAGTSAEAVIVRIGHLYGPGEGSYGKLIPITIKALLEGKPAVLFGSGEELRDLLYVGDAASMIDLAGRQPTANGATTVNLVAGTSYPVLDVIEMIRRIVGSSLPIERRPAAREARSFEFDATAVRTWLPTGPATPLEEGLRNEVEWFRATMA